jgi:hypothetical protein
LPNADPNTRSPFLSSAREMNRPLLTTHDGGGADAAAAWDARAELDLSIMIDRYLSENPPPKASQLQLDLRELVSLLRFDGEARLAELGVPPLRVAEEAG